jgi:hypothetical protein
MPLPYNGPPLPTVEQIAYELVADGEFCALQLGRFLSSPTGTFVKEAVEMAIPRAFAPEFELVVGGLRVAADLQQDRSEGRLSSPLGRAW